MNMNWNINKSASDFLLKNEATLLENESVNNMILGLANAVQNETTYASALFLTLENDAKNIAQAIRVSETKPLIITQMSDREIENLVAFLVSENISLVGVIGPDSVAESFSEIWANVKSVKYGVKIRLGIFELTRAIIPDLQGGEMERVTLADQDLAVDYLGRFITDCFPNDVAPKDRVKERCLKHIDSGNLYFWKSEGRFVSMAAIVRESRNASTISLVYTPELERGKGFGKRIVAKISELALKTGKAKCNLFTDLSNPISNILYPKVGYSLIGKSTHFTFSTVAEGTT